MPTCPAAREANPAPRNSHVHRGTARRNEPCRNLRGSYPPMRTGPADLRVAEKRPQGTERPVAPAGGPKPAVPWLVGRFAAAASRHTGVAIRPQILVRGVDCADQARLYVG